MTRIMGRWPSAHGQPTKIGPSDGCKGEAVHLAVDQWYDFHGFGCHLGNVGLEALAKGIIVRANLIIGFPGETPCEVYQTMLCVFKLVIKGVDEGLIDFPATIDGTQGYWCWKAGEDDIDWWHRRSSGFADRRPIAGLPPDQSDAQPGKSEP